MQPALDPCFAGDTVEAILDALAAEAASGSAHSGWAAETRAGLRARPNRSDIRKWQKRWHLYLVDTSKDGVNGDAPRRGTAGD